MAKFYPNHGGEYEVSSLQEIKELLGHHLDGFHYLEIDRNHVLAQHKADPSEICIGEVNGLPNDCISL